MSQKESPHLPLHFKFEEPIDSVDAKTYTRRELERVVEFTIDHILTLRQEIEDLNEKLNAIT